MPRQTAVAFDWGAFRNPSGSEYALFIYLPGSNARHLRVDANGETLIVQCDAPRPYERAFHLPVDSRTGEIRHSFNDGVLSVKIPLKAG